MDEADWRPWRAVFTKGFNTDHFLSLVPGMVKESRVYVETLKELARKGDTFYLDIISLRFMMDMIGKTILCVFSPRLAEQPLTWLGTLNLELKMVIIHWQIA